MTSLIERFKYLRLRRFDLLLTFFWGKLKFALFVRLKGYIWRIWKLQAL